MRWPLRPDAANSGHVRRSRILLPKLFRKQIMSQDTTTIEIRDDQQEALRDLKQHDRESYKSVLDRLLEGDTDTEPMRVVPIEDVVGREVPAESVDSDMQEQLDRIESGVREATNAAQSADKKLEGLGR